MSAYLIGADVLGHGGHHHGGGGAPGGRHTWGRDAFFRSYGYPYPYEVDIIDADACDYVGPEGECLVEAPNVIGAAARTKQTLIGQHLEWWEKGAIVVGALASLATLIEITARMNGRK